MTDVAELGFKIDSGQVETANKRLSDLPKNAKHAESATDQLASGFKRLVAPIAAAVSVMGGLNKLVAVSRQFDILNAGLITATGSANKAGVAFAALEKFASTTPYTLDQSVEAFTKLVNLGLNPSEKALRAYGDTAAAMGKDLSQLVEAVADATTGEFERLKEFGIKAKSEGDKVSFTFRGMTKTIGKNAAEIEQYLISLGQNNFAGAMAERMDSLDGALSNLQDQWDSLFRTISSHGTGELIEDAVRLATDALVNLQDYIESGGLAASIDVIKTKFLSWRTDVKQSIDIVGNSLENMFNFLGQQGPKAGDVLLDAFRNFPENVRAFVKIGVVEILSFFDNVIARAKWLKETIKNVFNESGREEATAQLEIELKNIESVRRSSIALILQERDAEISAADSKIAKVDELITKYQELKAAKAAAGEGVLGQFAIGGEATNAPDMSLKISDKQRGSMVDELHNEDAEALVREEKLLKEKLDLNTRYSEQQKAVIIDLAKFQKQTDEQKAKTAINAMTEMTGAFASHSKKAFEVNKKLRIAQAVIDGIGAVQAAYKFGASIGGPIGGVAAAGAAALFTAGQVRDIQSQEFGGGGQITVGGTSVGTNPPSAYSSTEKAPPIQPTGGSSNLADTPLSAQGKTKAPVVNIHDYRTNGADIETKSRTRSDGTSEIDFIIKDRVANLANTGELDDVMALNYGLQRTGRTR